MMLPSASRLTTEGQSVLPEGPGIHFGSPVFASMYATRLLVVPRSIPTVRPIAVIRQPCSSHLQGEASITHSTEPTHQETLRPEGLSYSNSFCTFTTKFRI